MKKSVLIFEPCLGAISGHWENLAESLTGAFSKSDLDVTLFGNKDQTHLHNKNLPIRPHFNQLPYVDYNNTAIMDSAKKNYLHSFLSINLDDFGPNPLLVFPTLYPPILEAALSWLIKLIDYDKIKPYDVIFIFQFPYTSKACHQTKLLKTSPFRQLYAVSSKLAKNFQTQYEVTVNELPMPIPLTTLPPIKQKSKNEAIKIGYFGHASVDKGFFFLHPLTQLTYQKPVEFHYHLNTNPETEVAAQAFKQPAKNICCYWGHLSKAKMTNLMAEMDILLLPYNAHLYATMPSAMFSEACLLGKVMVIPSNTWLSEQADLFQVGAITFTDHTIRSIHATLARTIENYEKLHLLSQTAREAFHQHHNVDNFVNIILKNKKMETHAHKLSDAHIYLNKICLKSNNYRL